MNLALLLTRCILSCTSQAPEAASTELPWGAEPRWQTALAETPVLLTGDARVVLAVELGQSSTGPRSFLTAMDPASGHVLWELRGPAGSGLPGGPGGLALDADRVLWSTSAGLTLCLARQDGRELWREDGGLSWMAPQIVNSNVVLVSSEGRVQARKVSDGSAIWEAQTPGPVFARPMANGERLAVTSWVQGLHWVRLSDGTVEAGLSLTQHRPLWAYPREDTLLIADGADGSIVALAADTGDPRWSSPTGLQTPPEPVIGPRSLIALASEGRILGLDPGSGEQRWSSALGAEGLHALLVGKCVAVATSKDVQIFDAGSGSPRGRLDRDHAVLGVAGETLLVGSRSRGVEAWETPCPP